MRTEYRVVDDEVWFVVRDLPERYHEMVRANYFEAVDGGFGRRFPAASRHLERAYANFERHVEALLLQHAGERAAPWDAALEAFLQAVAGHSIDWYLVGSAALAVRGLDVAPGDVDLVVDSAGAYRLGDVLADVLIEPVRPTPGWIGESFGRAFVEAVVEWVGGVLPVVDTYGPNDFGPAAAARLETVRWRGYTLRVPPLDLLLAVNERRGRTERAALIRNAIASRGSESASKRLID